MKILFVGDVFASSGRDLVRRAVRALAPSLAPDLVIANVENAAGGYGITRQTGDAILAAGVDVMTLGNHVWDKKEAREYLDAEPRLLRPANYPAGVPGRGATVVRTASGFPVGVLNLMGRVFMPPLDDPFAIALPAIEALRARCRVIIVDFHAEATSEKIAMSWHLDGLVTAVIGTHTHVQTADERILPGGTACITDIGMTGPHDGVIGTDRDATLRRFRTGVPSRLDPATGDLKLHAVVVTADDETGRAIAIERLSIAGADLGAARPPDPRDE